MKKLYKFLISFPFMGILFLILAFAMAIATFIESSYGSDAAKVLVYNSWWFFFVFFLLTINMVGNTVGTKNKKPKLFSGGLFHKAFIVIVIGAAITHFHSFEGMMHIREGETSNTILSSDSYVTIEYDGKKNQEKVLFTDFSKGDLNTSINVNGKTVHLKSVDFVRNARKVPVDFPSGKEMIDFVISTGHGMQSFVFQKDDALDLGSIKIAYGDTIADICFYNDGATLYLKSKDPFQSGSMSGGETKNHEANEPVEVLPMQLYSFDGFRLLLKKFYETAVFRVVPGRESGNNQGDDAVLVKLSDGEQETIVNVFGKKQQQGKSTDVSFSGIDMKISYGAIPITLPFDLKLRDFQLERYPGSESPSSFASELTLIDSEQNINKDIRVFMNNALKHRGYRFYQSSYDQDEQGTLLSVNADGLGTTVTYIGYGMLFLGIILSLLGRKSYFNILARRLKQSSKTVLVILFALLLGSSQARAGNNDLAGIPKLDKQLVKEFSELWVHGNDGRIEPISTLASELLRKISRQSSVEGRSAEEVLLSMYLYPGLWKTAPLIKVSNKQVQAQLGTKKRRLPLAHFFDESGNYLIAAQVQAAYAKMPTFRNRTDKEFIYVDERVNIAFMIFQGKLLSIFPTSKNEDAWLIPDAYPVDLPADDCALVNRDFSQIKKLKNREEILQIIKKVAVFQEKYAADLLPSKSRQKVEIFYNHFSPFKKVFIAYLLLGFVLLLVLFINIFRQKSINKYLKYTLVSFIAFGFVVHTVGLGMRWYASGHAPWSNGYESMIYVAWASVFAGFIFGRKYPLVIGTASFLAGITLFVAHLNWMNPEITNLVPVLKSYWLLFHVAVITGSYGFIGLSTFLGLLVLILYCMLTEKNRNNVGKYITQLTIINEMAVTVGLYMLTIGTFLGAIWANESWGRYWGWDPKETWALITIVLYAFISHMRLIPSLKGTYTYNLATVIGFSSVLMTYFGVNYYLNGLHSYGQGTMGAIHWSVYILVTVIIGIMILSSVKLKKFNVDV